MATIKISADRHVGTTKVLGPDGLQIRGLSDIKVYIKDSIWYADLELSPVHVDITVECQKAYYNMDQTKIPNPREHGVTIHFTPDQIRELLDGRLRVLSGGQKIGIGVLPTNG